MTRVAAAVPLTERGPDFPDLRGVAPRMHRDQQESLMAVDGTQQRMRHRPGAKIFAAGLDESDGLLARREKATHRIASVAKRPIGRPTSGEITGVARSAPRARIAASRFWFTTGAPELCAWIIRESRKSSETATCSTHWTTDQRPGAGRMAAKSSGRPRRASRKASRPVASSCRIPAFSCGCIASGTILGRPEWICHKGDGAPVSRITKALKRASPDAPGFFIRQSLVLGLVIHHSGDSRVS